MQRRTIRGQALVMTTLLVGIALIGAIGLALDTSHLYVQGQMAQPAADAAAEAAIMSMFNGTNVGTNAFGASTSYSHTCSTTDAITPCAYARKNGFGGTASDTVVVDVPKASDVGLDPSSLSTTDAVSLIRVTITRSVSNWLIPMLGAAGTSSINATATAAIVGVNEPIPIVVTHPSLSQSLYLNGATDTIQICGGPSKSIQVNSASSTALASGGSIDLSHAGPLDDGTCTKGTGADFGILGGPTTNPGNVQLGTLPGKYVSPSSVVQDPFQSFTQPSNPGGTAMTESSGTNIDNGIDGCSVPVSTCSSGKSCCTEYSPGLYSSLQISGGKPVIFKPGLYYIQGGGFGLKNVNGGGTSPAYSAMCSGCTADTNTGTGMVVFDTGSSKNPTTSGGFTIDTGVSMSLQGSTKTTTNAAGESVPASPYYGILFWEDRAADAHNGNGQTSKGGAHQLGIGNGCFTLIGTIYMTNSLSTMTSDSTHYQEVDYNGTPCSTTVQQGYIIAGVLQLKGTTTIKMNLTSHAFVSVRRIALVQ